MLVCTSSMGRAHPPEGNPKVTEEVEVGDREVLILRRETLRRERRSGRRGEHNNGMQRWGGHGGEREWEGNMKGMKLNISTG
jgi:hypothetical protein